MEVAVEAVDLTWAHERGRMSEVIGRGYVCCDVSGRLVALISGRLLLAAWSLN